MLGSPDGEPSRPRTSITLTALANALIVLTTSQTAPSIRYVYIQGASYWYGRDVLGGKKLIPYAKKW